MKITCTVREFALLVRGCEKNSCYNCPISAVCGDNGGIENFISAEDVVEETEEEKCND